MRRSALASGIGAALLLAAWGWTRPPAEVPGRYNVVLVVIDTLRADHLGAWGYERNTSPNLDRLAASGVRYTRAISQAPWTTASIGSLMTSRYPTSLGIEDERAALPEDVTTLAETLRGAGLATGAVVSHSFCSDEYAFDQGFDSFDDSWVLGHRGISSPGVTDAALTFLDAHASAPFFLWLHYFDPHFAYLLHEDHDLAPAKYRGPADDEVPFSELKEAGLGPDDLDEIRRRYDSEIALTDHHVGRVLDRLEALGIADRTLVIVTADHGEEFRDHGRLGHAATVYQEMVHAPLIVRCPGWEPAVVTVPVANLDIFPTVLACIGLEPPEGLVGTALGPEPPAPRTVFTQSAKKNRLVAAISGDHKLIGNRQRGYALYDLATDPGETVDLGPLDPKLLAELTAWEDALRASARPPTPVELDPDERARLEALGYAE